MLWITIPSNVFVACGERVGAVAVPPTFMAAYRSANPEPSEKMSYWRRFSAYFIRRALTESGVMAGSAWIMRAAIPETTAVAMLDPLSSKYGESTFAILGSLL